MSGIIGEKPTAQVNRVGAAIKNFDPTRVIALVVLQVVLVFGQKLRDINLAEILGQHWRGQKHPSPDDTAQVVGNSQSNPEPGQLDMVISYSGCHVVAPPYHRPRVIATAGAARCKNVTWRQAARLTARICSGAGGVLRYGVPGVSGSLEPVPDSPISSSADMIGLAARCGSGGINDGIGDFGFRPCRR